MSYELKSALFRRTDETFDGSFNTALLEQYKIYVQSAENVSARRIASSRYLLTINTALIAVYGLQSAHFINNPWTLVLPALGIPLAGILVSLLWYRIIKSHADLNRVKFKVIHNFEQHLPAAMYEYEWLLANEGKGKAYLSVTKLERWLPISFGVLHATVLIVLLATLSFLKSVP